MTDTNLQNKARAVVLSALMVLSVMVGTIALSGGAAAAASTATLETKQVAAGGDVVVSGTDDADNLTDGSPDDPIYVYVDLNGDGVFQTSDMEKKVADTTEETSSSSFKTTFDAPATSGTYSVFVYEASSSTGLADGDSFSGINVGKLTVDADNPKADYKAPTGTVTTSSPTIDVALNGTGTAINESTIDVSVTGPNGVIFTHEIDSDVSGDGIEFSNGNLTLTPGTGNVPALPEGQIDVSIEAEDAVGNSIAGTGELTFNFVVDKTGLDFTLNQPTAGDSYGKTSQTIAVSIDGGTVNDSTAELTVSGPNGVIFTNVTKDDAYDKANDKFSVTTGQSGVPALPNGTIDVTVSAADDHGNSDSETFSFQVDNQKPTITDIAVEDTPLNVSDTTDKVDVTVTFDENVAADTVTGVLKADGWGSIPLGTFSDVANDGTKSVVHTQVDLSGAAAIEDASASVNITAASDDVANNPNGLSAKEFNTTFAVDTTKPSVSDDTNLPDTLSGYVDFTDHYSVSADDGNGLTYWVAVDDGDIAADDYGKILSPSHVNTSDAAEGNFVLKVQSTDDAGNVHSVTEQFTIDNAEPSLSYDKDATLTGKVNITTFLTVENAGVGTGDIVYKYISAEDGDFGDTNDVTTTADEFNVNTQGEGLYKLVAVVEDPGYDKSATDTLTTKALTAEKFDSGDFDINAERFPKDLKDSELDPGDLNITIESDYDLSGLNVTIESFDGYHSQNSETLSIEKFTEKKLGDGSYNYTLTTYETPRDGLYKISLDNATTTGGLTLDSGVESKEIKADSGHVNLADADVIGATSEGHTKVKLTFSEPIDGLEKSDIAFEGVTAATFTDNDDGTVVVTFGKEIQTGGENANITLVKESFTETFSNDPKSDSSTGPYKMPVDSIELDLEKGTNFVSVPIEAGSVDFEDVNFCGCVEVIWTYDNGKWMSYDPEAKENDFSAFEAGQGYLIDAKKDTEIDVRGFTKYGAGSVGDENMPETYGEQELESGWNLIGHYQEGSQPVDQALALLDGSTYSVENADTQVQVDTLRAGEGYWLLTDDKSGLHAPVNYDGMNSEQPSIKLFDVSSSGQDVDVKLITDEPLATIHVAGTQDADGMLSESDFTMSTSGGDYIYTADLSTGSDGTLGAYLLSAEDADGNDGAANEMDSVTVDLDDPSASVTRTATSDVTGSSVDVSSWFSVNKDGGTATYEYSADGGDSWSSISDATAWDSNNADDGSVKVRVTVDDGEGNTKTATATVTVDNNQGSASKSSSFPSSDVTGSSVDVTTWFDTSADGGSVTYEYTTAGGSSWTEITSGSWDTTTLSDGDYDVRVTVTDGEGNKNTASGTVTVDNTASAHASGYPSTSGTTGDSSITVHDKAAIEGGTSYFVVVSSGANAPSASQVKAGNDATGSAALSSGSFSVSTSAENTGTASGLTASTSYDIYVVIYDGEGNPSDVKKVTATA
ncbi:surface glycoprotein [Halobacterium zhouii]|uniref:surface glycoprotein n=1 Tax=Halobacterium zhouii TaxID=2902624 RepID=UPI001E41A1FE|nr:surface glycoprotein [Halobacterium zhouii]